jgi:Flp pilus assembly protein CpaB
MRRMKFIILTIIVTVILLVIEASVIKKVIGYEEEKTVIIAIKTIEVGAIIKKDMVKQMEMNVKDIHSNYITSMQEVVGKTAQEKIHIGEIILRNKINPEANHFVSDAKEDSRYFSLEFKGDQANGWWLNQGQLVDIIFVPDFKTLEEGERTVESEALKAKGVMKGGGVWRLSRIKIAAVIDENGKIIKNSRERVLLPKFISFEVTPEQDTFLAYAKGAGRLELSALPANISNE